MIRLKILFFVLCSLFFVLGYSQKDSIPKPKHSVQSVEFLFDGFINSNAISNHFIKAFYNGKFLDDNLKGKVSDALSFENRLGAEAKTGFTYTYHSLKGKNKPTFSFSFFDRETFSASFSKDLFNVIFYGNQMYAGDTAKLWNFRVNYLRYQQFRFGWKWNGDARHGSFGVAFSVLNGDQNLYIDGSTAGLYTAPDGSYLSMPLRMDVYHSNLSQQNYFSHNGTGMSADFFYELPYTFFDKPGKITVAVSDLGFIRWNNNAVHYAVDSFYYFSGVTVKNLVHLDSSSFSPSNTNHFINSNSKIEKNYYTTYIPCTFDIHTKTLYGKYFALEKGFKYYFNTSAMPYFYAKLYYNAGKRQNIHFAYIMGYGGFGKFHAGMETNFDFGKNYSIALADNYLFSGVGQTAYGMAAFVKLARRF